MRQNYNGKPITMICPGKKYYQTITVKFLNQQKYATKGAFENKGSMYKIFKSLNL